jgi:hypothetical protein
MELSEIERELALAHGSGAAGDGHGSGEGAKGTLMEGIANVCLPLRSTLVSLRLPDLKRVSWTLLGRDSC